MIREGYLVPESHRALEVRQELEDSGYEVEYWSSGPGAVLSGLQFLADALIYLDRGEACLEVGEDEMVLRAGDRVLVPGGSAHTIRNRGAEALAWLSAVRSPGT